MADARSRKERELELLRLRRQRLELEAREPQVSAGEALRQGAREGATLGFAGELTGAAQRGIARVEQGIGTARQALGLGGEEQLARAQATLDVPREELVRQEEAEIQQAREARPGAFLAGQIAGGAPAAGAVAASGAPALVGAAALGGAQAAGEAEGSIADRLDDAVLGAATGAALGAGLSKAGVAISNRIKSVASGLQGIAQRLSTKAAQLRDVRGLNLKEVRKLGQKLLDEKITSKPGSLSVLRKRLKSVTERSGKFVKDTYSRLDDAVGPEDIPTKDELAQSVLDDLGAGARRSDLTDIAEKELNSFLAAKKRPDNLKPTDIVELIGDIEDEARRFAGPVVADVENKRNILIQISKNLRGKLKDAARRSFPEDAGKFDNALEAFAILKRAEGEVENAFISQFRSGASRIAGPGVGQRLIDATVASTPVKTGLAGSLNAAQRLLRRGARLGEFAPALRAAADRGEQALNAAVFVLSQQNPKFRKMLQGEAQKQDKKNEQ